MKKIAVIGVLLGTMFVVAPAGVSAAPGNKSEGAPEGDQLLSGQRSEAEASESRQRLEGRLKSEFGDKVSIVREGLTAREKTNFLLSGGDIGDVNMDSIVQDRHPHSMIALLQAHSDLTGANELLELEIGSVSEYPNVTVVRFDQVIEGKATPGRVSLSMDSSGALERIKGTLVDSRAVRARNLNVSRTEAEAIALELVVRYADKLPVHPRFRENPLRVDFSDSELAKFWEIRYELDSNNELHRYWRIFLNINGKKRDSVEVVISTETGEVMHMRSTIVSCPPQQFEEKVATNTGKVLRVERQFEY